jgi:hypothetical protein
MKEPQNFATSSSLRLAGLLLLGVLAMLTPAGCKQSGHTSDRRLKQIDEMLDSQLPVGTAKSRVSFFLSSQGFPLESTNNPHALVAIIHHVDTETLQPATARVTFRFDPSDNLKSYELVSVAGAASQP